MKKNSNWRTICEKMIIVIGVLAMIPIIWISKYNYPSADDYNFSESYTWDIAHNGGSPMELLSGAMKTVIQFYNGWQGTYAASFFASLHPGIYGNHERFYAITAVIILVNTLISTFLFLKELMKYLQMEWKKCIIIVIPIFLAMIEGLPSPVQGLFWYTGCMTYMYFWTVMMTMTALLLSNLSDEKMKWWKFVAGMILGFVAVGGNHVTAFASVLISIGFVVYSCVKKQWSKLVVSGTVCFMTIFGFLLMAFSPGTAARASVLDRQSVSKTVMVSALSCLDEWQSNFRFQVVCTLAIIALFASGRIVNEKNKDKFKFRYFIGMLILFYGLYCAMLCVPYYPMGFFGAGRVDDVRYVTFILMMVVMFFYLLGCLEAAIMKQKKLSDGIKEVRSLLGKSEFKKWIVLLVFIAMIFITIFSGGLVKNVSYQCTRQLLNGEARQYGQECVENYGHDVENPSVRPSMTFYTSLE